MSLEIKGKIKTVLPLETGEKNGKTWKKQSFVVDTGDQYNPDVCFTLFGDEKVDSFAKYNKAGQDVTVKFNVSSREFNGKWYHNLDAWYIGVEGAATSETPTPSATATKKGKKVEEEESDDLPF